MCQVHYALGKQVADDLGEYDEMMYEGLQKTWMMI